MKYLSIIVLLSVRLITSAQVSDSVAGKLLHQELIYWQAENDSVKFYALLNKAKINRDAGLYYNALDELTRADSIAKTSTETVEYTYEKMVNYFLSDQYNLCSDIVMDSNCIGKHLGEYTIMRLYSLNESDKWERCKAEMLKQCHSCNAAKIDSIKQLPVSYKYKSPEKSRLMSSILPGLGETYAGYPFKGATSFLLNAGFLAFTGYNVYYGYYITGAVSGLFPFLKLHGGGKHLSAILARKHNEGEEDKVKRRYSEQIGSILH